MKTLIQGFAGALRATLLGIAVFGITTAPLPAQTLGTAQAQTMPSVALTATTNQIATGAGSNITTLNFPASSGAVTLTFPTTSSTLMALNGTDAGSEITKFCTTQFDAVTGTTGATLTNVVGLTGFSLAAAGVYKFVIHISGVGTTNSGMKIGLGYTTLTATSIESAAQGFTAAAVAVQHTTTATSGMTLFGQTAAVIDVEIEGRLIVNAAGTVAVQAAQNAAHTDTTSVYVGSWATFTRIS